MGKFRRWMVVTVTHQREGAYCANIPDSLERTSVLPIWLATYSTQQRGHCQWSHSCKGTRASVPIQAVTALRDISVGSTLSRLEVTGGSFCGKGQVDVASSTPTHWVAPPTERLLTSNWKSTLRGQRQCTFLGSLFLDEEQCPTRSRNSAMQT